MLYNINFDLSLCPVFIFLLSSRKGKTESTRVVLDPVFATGAVPFRLRKNDYIIYGGTSARIDNVEMALAKPNSEVAEKVEKLKEEKASTFVDHSAVRIPAQPLPHHALPQGEIEIVDSKGVQRGKKGFVAGKYCLFHGGDSIRLKGSGYFRVRWEVEHWVGAGRIHLPTMEGDLVPIGGNGGYNTADGNSYPIVGPLNKYYYLNGECFIKIHEQGAKYNVTVTPTSYSGVIGSLDIVY